MRKSFYTWLMTQRNPKSHEPVAILADLFLKIPLFQSTLMILKPLVAIWKMRLALLLISVNLIKFGKIIWRINDG